MRGHRKVSNIVYQTEAEVQSVLLEVIVFAIFLTVTTVIALSCENIHIFYFDQSIDRLFFRRSLSNNIQFKDIVTIDEWWDFVEHNFIKILDANLEVDEVNSKIEKESIQPGPMINRRFMRTDIIIEAPRLRQIRVKPRSNCLGHEVFNKYFSNCYSAYSRQNEYKEPIYKGTKFYENHGVAPIRGTVNTYYGAGYVAFLTHDLEENKNIVKKLRESQWIDRGTCLVLIEFCSYNANMDYFNNIKIVAEVLQIGGLVPFRDIQTAPLTTFWSLNKPTTLAAAIIFYSILFYFTAKEIWEIGKFGYGTYLKSSWNYVDWGIILSAYVTLAVSVLQLFFIDKYFNNMYKTSDTLPSLDVVCDTHTIYTSGMAICTLLVYIRIFRFISFNETMLQFAMALRKCAPEIFGFAIMFSIVLMAFAILGLLLFGTLNEDFSTFQHAYFFMLRLILHDFDYKSIEEADQILGPIFFMTFIVVVVFILLNMFLAIISDTYINVKKQPIVGHSVIKVFFIGLLYKFINWLKLLRRKGMSPAPSTKSMTSQSSSDVQKRNALDKESAVHKLRTASANDSETEEEPTTSAQQPKNDTKEMNKDEALKEYFGVQEEPSESTSESTSVSSKSWSSPPVDSPGSSDEFTTGLPQRLDYLDSLLEKLNHDLQRITKKLEAKKDIKRD